MGCIYMVEACFGELGFSQRFSLVVPASAVLNIFLFMIFNYVWRGLARAMALHSGTQ